MSCDKFEEYISLHVDGKLDPAGERSLREHLAGCPRCRETLAALESVEKTVRSAEAKEPRAGYWDTFSGRVMQRIESEEERRAESGWVKWLPVVRPSAGRRLRFAAGVASIAVAVVVGVLFVARQGERAIPTALQPLERETPVEKGKDVLAEGEKPSDKEKAVAVEKKEVPPPAVKTEAPPAAAKTENAPPPAQTQAVPAPKEATPPSAKNEVLDVAAKTEPAREDKASAPAAEKMAQPRTTSFTTADRLTSVTASDRTQAAGGVARQEVSDRDTMLTVEELRAFIAGWKTQIAASPADSLTNEGYREVATAYCVLAKQTGDGADIEEGARVIRTYLESSRDPATREFLAVRLQELQELRKK